MISVIIPTLNDAANLPRALAPLVAGVADGVVKEAVIVDGGSSDETTAVAEAAGCDVVRLEGSRARRLIAGARAARGDWLLFLSADAILCEGWLEEARRFMGKPGAQSRAATFRLAFEEDAPLAKRIVLSARMRTEMFGRPYGDQGLLISRRLYDIVGGYQDMGQNEDEDLARRIGRQRLTLFRTEVIANFERHKRRRAETFARYLRAIPMKRGIEAED
ncbi:MAG TPA: glycosyltransferase [Caulobacterales bacterium]|nr:glycosyltransferase [Caulobacterales bacterium]